MEEERPVTIKEEVLDIDEIYCGSIYPPEEEDVQELAMRKKTGGALPNQNIGSRNPHNRRSCLAPEPSLRTPKVKEEMNSETSGGEDDIDTYRRHHSDVYHKDMSNMDDDDCIFCERISKSQSHRSNMTPDNCQYCYYLNGTRPDILQDHNCEFCNRKGYNEVVEYQKPPDCAFCDHERRLKV